MPRSVPRQPAEPFDDDPERPDGIDPEEWAEYKIRRAYFRLMDSRSDPEKNARAKLLRSFRAAVWAKTDGDCWYCCKAINPFVDFTMDHVIPVSRGGRDELDNLVPCCKKCNNTKGSK